MACKFTPQYYYEKEAEKMMMKGSRKRRRGTEEGEKERCRGGRRKWRDRMSRSSKLDTFTTVGRSI
jgi:hypothetical protein